MSYSTQFELSQCIQRLHSSGMDKQTIKKYIEPTIVDEVFKLIEVKEKAVRKEKELADRLSFCLTEDHLKLLKQFYVEWDTSEFGAPRIDSKRPYGNSDVEDDIREILGKKLSDSRCRDLHEETRFALQIILKNSSIQLGDYQRKNNYSQEWNLTELQKKPSVSEVRKN